MDLSNLNKKELLVVAKYYKLNATARMTRSEIEALIFLHQIKCYMNWDECPLELEEEFVDKMDETH